MCLKHVDFRKTLTDSSFNNLAAVIVDEAHCIGQWGGDFRTAYSELEKLRAFFPPDTPIVGTTATVTPQGLREIRSTLGIDAASCFHINLGNDRPNISYEVHRISSPKDVQALRPFLTRTKEDPTSPDDIIKGIVFVNTKLASQTTARTIRNWFPKHLRKYVDYMHALRSPRSKRRAMRRFRKGKTKILVATEAAGMVRDFTITISQLLTFLSRELTFQTLNKLFSLVCRPHYLFGSNVPAELEDHARLTHGQFFLSKKQCLNDKGVNDGNPVACHRT